MPTSVGVYFSVWRGAVAYILAGRDDQTVEVFCVLDAFFDAALDRAADLSVGLFFGVYRCSGRRAGEREERWGERREGEELSSFFGGHYPTQMKEI